MNRTILFLAGLALMTPRAFAAGTAGCGLTGKPTGDLQLTTTDGRGVTRNYEVLVPVGYDASTPLPVSFVYHGANNTSAGAKGFGLQNAPGALASGIFVFPQGVNFQTFGVGWDDSVNGYDVVFFDHMLASLESTYCTDASRVFLAGFSWGCDEVTGLMCARGDHIKAVAAASCTDDYSDPTDYRTYQSCPVQNKAAIRFTHDASGGDSGYPIPLFVTTSALYRSFNSCTSASSPTSTSPCVSYSGCATPYVECPYPSLGHSLPANWGTQSWAFFTANSNSNPCDVNGSGGSVDAADVQQSVNRVIGTTACVPPVGDINGDGKCDVIDVQRVVNAVLGGQCVSP